MNDLFLPKRSRMNSGAWTFDDAEDVFDGFVLLPAHKFARSHELNTDSLSVPQAKWEIRVEARLRSRSLLARKIDENGKEPSAHTPSTGINGKNTAYPSSLIRWFALGVCFFLLGILLLPLTMFFEIGPLDFVTVVLMASGASLVALTVSRGQEIDESGA